LTKWLYPSKRDNKKINYYLTIYWNVASLYLGFHEISFLGDISNEEKLSRYHKHFPE
jgi:hypothetical protein